MSRLNNNIPGYTLVEILLVLGLITVLAGLSMPVYQSFQVKNSLAQGAFNTTQALRRAQILSQAVEGNSNWGVKVESEKIILFKGAGFDGHDATYDEITQLPGGITPSGKTEFVFEKLSGAPIASGAMTLSSDSGEQDTITVNSKGMVEY